MHKLIQFRLCPRSRSVRLLLGELQIAYGMVDERPWEYRSELLAMNPSGELPILMIDGGPVLCGSYAISEYVAEEVMSLAGSKHVAPLLPASREDRAEVRRLIDWFHGKFQREVTDEMLEERVYRAYRSAGAPDATYLRSARTSLRYHMSYVAYLAHDRRWLGGDEISFADLAAAAHLSTLDFLGEVPWEEFPAARDWYQRVKSRPSFRDLLGDRISGVAPPMHYADLDF